MNTKQIRIKNGWTQRQFAELIGVSVRTVQNWDQGIRSPDRRSKIAIERLISFSDLTYKLSETDNSPKDKEESERLKGIYKKFKDKGIKL